MPPDEKVSRRKHPACKRANADCSLMDNSHWKTPPYWTSKSHLILFLYYIKFFWFDFESQKSMNNIYGSQSFAVKNL